jgi:hypothetical protein
LGVTPIAVSIFSPPLFTKIMLYHAFSRRIWLSTCLASLSAIGLPAIAQAGNLTYDLTFDADAVKLSVPSFGFSTSVNPPSINRQVTVPDDDAAYTDGLLDLDTLLIALGFPGDSVTNLTPIPERTSLGDGAIWVDSTPGTTGAFSISAAGVVLTSDAIGIIGQCKTVICQFKGNFGFKAIASPELIRRYAGFTPPSALPFLAEGRFTGRTAPVTAVPTPSLLGGLAMFGLQTWRKRAKAIA